MANQRWIVELLHNVRNEEMWEVKVLKIPRQKRNFLLYYGDKQIRQGTTGKDGKRPFTIHQSDFGEVPQWDKLRVEEVRDEPARPAPDPAPIPVPEPAPQPAPAPTQPDPVRVRNEPRRNLQRERQEPRSFTMSDVENFVRDILTSAKKTSPEWKDLNVEILSATSQGNQGTMVVAQVTGKNGDSTRKGVKGASVVFSDTGVKKETKKTNTAGLAEYLAPRVGVREVHVALAGSSPVSEDHTFVY